MALNFPQMRGFCLLSLAVITSAAGCGSADFYPVSGKVVGPDRQPIAGLEGSRLIFEATEQKTSSAGDIEPDGSVRMFTEKPFDGVRPGKYRVLIERKYLDPERAAPRAVKAKYEALDTSGLEFEVQPKENQFEFVVEPIGGT